MSEIFDVRPGRRGVAENDCQRKMARLTRLLSPLAPTSLRPQSHRLGRNPAPSPRTGSGPPYLAHRLHAAFVLLKGRATLTERSRERALDCALPTSEVAGRHVSTFQNNRHSPSANSTSTAATATQTNRLRWGAGGGLGVSVTGGRPHMTGHVMGRACSRLPQHRRGNPSRAWSLDAKRTRAWPEPTTESRLGSVTEWRRWPPAQPTKRHG